MKRPLAALLLAGLSATPVSAAITLFDYAYNTDGVVTPASGVPGGVNDSGFDYSTGLGTIVLTVSTTGSHFAGLFLDHEIDELENTFFNEFGVVHGAPAAGWSWEIDEPGFLFGDIYLNFLASDSSASALDNSNGVPDSRPDDVSMAMGWSFNLAPAETALITFSLSTTRPASGFFLEQRDPDSDQSVYFSGLGRIDSGGTPVPEGVNSGLAFGLVSLMGYLYRRRLARGPAPIRAA